MSDVKVKRGFTRPEAATYLGTTVWRIDQLKRDGELVGRQMGSQSIVFDQKELDRYFDSLPPA